MTLRKVVFKLGIVPLSGVMIAALVAGAGLSSSGGNITSAATILTSASKRPLAVRAAPAAGATTPAIVPFFNGFEQNVISWCMFLAPPAQPPCDGTPGGGNYGTITRVSDTASAAPYGTGIHPSSGTHYASVNGTGIGISGCPTYTPPSGDESCTGPFTTWNNNKGNYDTFKPFHTDLDIYLDTTWAQAHPGNEFEWDTALNASNGNFLQDYIFTAETFNSGGTTGCSSVTHAGFVVGYASNTNNDPGSGGGGLGSFTPACITTTGWYRFVHRFYNNGGKLGLEMSVLALPSGTPVGDFTATWNGSGVPSLTAACSPFPASCATAGGPLYGWFPNENVPGLPIDNTRLTTP